MGMKYYALFLDGETYIEKCLIMLRNVCNPRSVSLPHITVRLFKDTDERALETGERIIKKLNIIEPGNFNFEQGNIREGSYVVYLRCESDELEGLEYKPSYPQSRLHLTIYEGPDYGFAKKLYKILQECRWHFTINFPDGKKLTERELGRKPLKKPEFKRFYEDIFEQPYRDFSRSLLRGGDDYRLKKIRDIVNKINAYIYTESLAKIDSVYSLNSELKYSNEDLVNQQEEFDINSGNYVFKKPCRDNIFITPPEYARDMAVSGIKAFTQYCAGKFKYKIAFADSAIGTGSLYRALLDEVQAYNEEDWNQLEIVDAFGMDIDKSMAREASIRYKKRDLHVEWGNALNIRKTKINRFNLMMVNPPFNRHNEIPVDYKTIIRDVAEQVTGIRVSEQAGLFVYYVLIMHSWLADDGIGVWLLPTFFMQTKYGIALKEYFLKCVKLLHIHIYDESHEQFFDTNVSTSIIVFQKSKDFSGTIGFSFGKSMSKPEMNLRVERRDLTVFGNWRNIFNISKNGKRSRIYDALQSCSQEDTRLFGDFFEVKRGIATGANDFFVLQRSKAYDLGIPDCALRPLLPKARLLPEQIVESDIDGYPRLDSQLVLIDSDLDERIIKKKYPGFYDYLQEGKVSRGNVRAVTEGALVKSRNPWYSQEKRAVPKYLLTYMGRDKKELGKSALFFILNRSQAVALNTYLLLYPKGILEELLEDNPAGEEYVLRVIQNMADSIAENSRIYAGGLKKIEPRELLRFPLEELDLDYLRMLKR